MSTIETPKQPPRGAAIRAIIREALQPGVTARSVMAKYGLNDAQFYTWKQAIEDMLAPEDEPETLKAVIVRMAVSTHNSRVGV